MKNNGGRLFIISAPSGTGKTTVIKRLLELRRDIFFSVSATTRKRRDGETDGVHYHFVTDAEFDDMLAKDELLEHAEFAGSRYGTPAGPIWERLSKGIDVLLDIDVQGFRQVITKIPDAVSIFIVPPNLTELGRRLRGRGTDTEEKICKRLELASCELMAADEYKYVVVNDDVENAANKILCIINRNN